ncbi:uncharacterized protein RCC_08175 [Ramularia collo-cygni]|uniref:F-box domain-containing protein n=1 Tax=Ramularia collo-cygni TaxID=112498 RepID=A0A2D3VEK4_9PEZI|nr:uncharacterized protein RCC_08175 [Ramularia collo-cygni]CZT22306.1 uncharacterized protein RCC_08175 [Ramularia collo-cygni]
MPVGLSLSVRKTHTAVSNLQEIQYALSEISELADAGETIDADTLRCILDDAEYSVGELARLFTAADPIFYNVRQTSRSAALAQKTFAATELLEMVLLNLSPRTLFNAQPTSKKFFETIEASSKLQRKMMLNRSNRDVFSTFLPSGGWRCNIETLLGLSYRIRPPAVFYEDEEDTAPFYTGGTDRADMDLFVYVDPGQLPRVGARCQKILLCEPIITSITVFPGCCGAIGSSEYPIIWRSEEQDSVHEISNPSGMTIGDIYKAASLVEAHPECHFRGVTFRGTISVRRADPVARRYLDIWEASQSSNESVEFEDFQGPLEIPQAEDGTVNERDEADSEAENETLKAADELYDELTEP